MSETGKSWYEVAQEQEVEIARLRAEVERCKVPQCAGCDSLRLQLGESRSMLAARDRVIEAWVEYDKARQADSFDEGRKLVKARRLTAELEEGK